MKSAKSILLNIIALLGVSGLLHAQEPDKGLLYEISGNGLKKPSYLFGTFHILKSGYFDEHPLVNRYFETVDKLVVEVEMEPGALAAVKDAMQMPDISVTDYLTPEEVHKIDRELIRSTGSGIDSYEHIKPSAIMINLTSSTPSKSKEKYARYDGEVMDSYLMHKAHDTNKEVISLETVQDQIDVLFGEPVELQIAELKDYLNADKEDNNMNGKLVDMYFNEDLAGLYRLALDYPDQIGDMDRMLTNRNNNWMKKLPGLLSDNSCFIAVGALHLAGPIGLVYQLRQAGYTVKPLAAKQ